MKYLFCLLLIVNNSFSSSSLHTELSKEDQRYSDYVLTKPSDKKTKAVYKCTCENRDWKQDATKVKACPYCGPAMSQCGYLVKVLPARKIKYSANEYSLPNKICPVSSKKIKSLKHIVEINKMKVHLCCKSCVKKFNKSVKKQKQDRYLRKLELKPELFGFSKKS